MNLLIVGAGGHGRCCLDIARDMNVFDKIAFLDNNHINEMINDCNVIGSIDEMSSYYPEYTHIFVVIGNNKVRSKLILQAQEIGYSLPILKHSTSVVSRYASIGDGSVVFPNAVIEANAAIKEGCIIAANSVVNHDAVIEDYCLIYCNEVIRPNVLIGTLSIIADQCVIKSYVELPANSNIENGCEVNCNV
ncbi:PglD-related sugar-binding protein [Thomasclavelia sp.]